MRKSMWLLAASAMLLPGVSQAAIIVRAVPGPVPVAPVGEVQENFVDIVVETDGADVGKTLDGFILTVSLVDPTGRATLLSPFGKRTDASDLDKAPVVETARPQLLSSAGILITRQGNKVVGEVAGTGASEALAGTLGLMRIPLAISNAQIGDVYSIVISTDPGETALLSVATGELTTVPITSFENGSITVVPEPASLGLLAVGALVALRRRRTA